MSTRVACTQIKAQLSKQRSICEPVSWSLLLQLSQLSAQPGIFECKDVDSTFEGKLQHRTLVKIAGTNAN